MQNTIGGRLHSNHFRTARGDEHEVVLGAVGFEKRFDFRHQLEFAHPWFDHFCKALVAAIRKIHGLFQITISSAVLTLRSSSTAAVAETGEPSMKRCSIHSRPAIACAP